MDLFQRFIFGGKSEGEPPRVWLVWDNGNTNQDDLVCTNTTCTYQIYCGRSDTDNDITNVEIFMSTDLGASWNSIISSLSGNTFGDQITSGARWYKAVAKDSEGHQVTSNILKIVKQSPAFGDMVLVYNNVQYQEWDMGKPGLPTPINMVPSEGGIISFYFKNIHPTDFVQCMGINPPTVTNAMAIHKYGDSTISPTVITSPQDGEKIMPNVQLPGAFQRDSHTGLYVINLTQAVGQWGGNNIPGGVTWLINIGSTNTCSRYKATNYNGQGIWPQDGLPVDIQIINCNSEVETKTVPAGSWQEIGSPVPGAGVNNYVYVPGELEFCAISINNANGATVEPISGTCP